MDICTCIYVCIRTYMHTYIQTYVHTYVCMNVFTLNTSMHTYKTPVYFQSKV
jgi:hypothetical protein